MQEFSFSRMTALIAACFCLLASSNGAKAMPTVVDFESVPLGNAGPSYTESGVTFTPLAPGDRLVVLNFGIGGNAIIGDGPTFAPVRADIAGLANMVSVLIGDNNADNEQAFLRAFDSLNSQIAQATVNLMGAGFQTLTVNVPNIAYVEFGATGGTNGSSAGIDEFGFTRQPSPPTQATEPGMLALFGLGLAGIGVAARRKRKVA